MASEKMRHLRPRKSGIHIIHHSRRVAIISSRLATILLLSLASASLGINKNTSPLLLPRDVSYDNEARKALSKIRRQQHQDAHEDAERILASCGNDDRATLTMMGYKGGRIQDQVNQDCAFVGYQFLSIDAINSTTINMMMGVFDGHGIGGEVVAEYSLQQLPERLSQKLQDAFNNDKESHESMDERVKQALKDTFVEIDESIPLHQQGGCTASIVLQLDDKLYIANVGDSISFVAIHNAVVNSTRVVYKTREDKPFLPEEYERITQMGGVVSIPKDLRLDSSRVMYTDPQTGYQSGLAMSRSIGDREMVGVIAKPLVDVIDLREVIANETKSMNDANDETCSTDELKESIFIFAISATDGMMDYLSPQELAVSFARALYHEDGPHPLTAAQDAILHAAKEWNVEMNGEYRDDIAIAVSKVILDSTMDIGVEEESSSS